MSFISGPRSRVIQELRLDQDRSALFLEERSRFMCLYLSRCKYPSMHSPYSVVTSILQGEQSSTWAVQYYNTITLVTNPTALPFASRTVILEQNPRTSLRNLSTCMRLQNVNKLVNRSGRGKLSVPVPQTIPDSDGARSGSHIPQIHEVDNGLHSRVKRFKQKFRLLIFATNIYLLPTFYNYGNFKAYKLQLNTS